jgi:hypothetical protein
MKADSSSSSSSSSFLSCSAMFKFKEVFRLWVSFHAASPWAYFPLSPFFSIIAQLNNQTEFYSGCILL